MEMLEDLKGDSPKLLGFDYYNVIYGTAFFLMTSMVFVYFSVDDEKLKRMVLVQGSLSLCLMFSLMYYQHRVNKRKAEDQKRKMEKE